MLTHWGEDQDVFASIARAASSRCRCFRARRQAHGKPGVQPTGPRAADDEVLEQVDPILPGRRLRPTNPLPVALEDAEVARDYLSERKGKRVEVLWPQRGDKVRLVADGRRERAPRLQERQDADDKNDA